MSSVLPDEGHGVAGGLRTASIKRIERKFEMNKTLHKLLEEASSAEAGIVASLLRRMHEPGQNFRRFYVYFARQLQVAEEDDPNKRPKIKEELILALKADWPPRVKRAIMYTLCSYIGEYNPEDEGVVAIERCLKNDPSPQVRKAAKESIEILLGNLFAGELEKGGESASMALKTFLEEGLI